MNYAGQMDSECIPICDALNSLPGISTCESCCGHGRINFRVFFTVEKCQQLAPILNGIASLRERYLGWKLIPGGFPAGEDVTFCLEGPVNGTDEAMEIAAVLREDKDRWWKSDRTHTVDDPHIVVFTVDGELHTDIIYKKGETYRNFAIMTADIVRHVAYAFKVDESLVWLWVDKERYKPTSPILEVTEIHRCNGK